MTSGSIVEFYILTLLQQAREREGSKNDSNGSR